MIPEKKNAAGGGVSESSLGGRIEMKGSSTALNLQDHILKNSALALAERGKAVFPLIVQGKSPLTRHGCKDSSLDPAAITAWWTEWPQANIGVATGPISGFWVLDVDGIEGEKTLLELESRHEPLPQTVEVITGGGGRHIYFLWPEQGGISNSAGKLGPGLDVRGGGGYVVAPPSVHQSGRSYTWSVDSGDMILPAPPWLISLIQHGPEGMKAAMPVATWRELVQGVGEGQRNDSIARLAGKMMRVRLDPFVVLELCLAFNDARCTPPLARNEVVQIVNSIAGRELSRRGGHHG